MSYTKEELAHRRRVRLAFKAFRKRDVAARKQRPLHTFYVWMERANTAVYPGARACTVRVAKLPKSRDVGAIYDRMGPSATRPVSVRALDTQDARVQAAKRGVSCRGR